ncbi:MAG: TIGR01212 family radical SAM protein [Desulfosudaceae bacterium]
MIAAVLITIVNLKISGFGEEVKFIMGNRPYLDLNTFLRSVYGCRVQKISLDAGFSCPNRDGRIATGGCLYCNSRGSGTGAHARGLSLTEQLLAGKTALRKRYQAGKFIAYFQAYTNTYGPVDRLRALYEEALAVEDVVGLSVGTRPDCVDEPILDLLQEYAEDYMVWLEYGVQSASDDTLARINRGHDFACVERAVAAARNRGLRICAHVILGLPGETRADMLHTAEQIARLGLAGIKIHLLYVVQDTPLAAMYRSGLYQCLSFQEYVSLVCDVLERLPADMVIQRLTGDPHRSELVAPLWALEKQSTLAAIEQTLAARGTRQGSRAGTGVVPGGSSGGSSGG